MRSSSYHFSITEEKLNGLRLWPEGNNRRGKEIYLFKYTIYHALIKYSSGISPELYREDQSACYGHLGFTATVLYPFISTAFPKEATKLTPRCWQLLLHPSLHQPAVSHLMVSVYNIYALLWNSQSSSLLPKFWSLWNTEKIFSVTKM